MKNLQTIFSSMSDVRNLNKEKGFHFFDRDSMRFFKCNIESSLLRGRYFVTSEKNGDKFPRMFSVRMAKDDGSIETLGNFQMFHGKESAKSFIKNLPTYFYEAYEDFSRSYYEKNDSNFYNNAIIEIENSGVYNLSTYCGACSFLVDEAELLDIHGVSNYMKEWSEKMEEV